MKFVIRSKPSRAQEVKELKDKVLELQHAFEQTLSVSVEDLTSAKTYTGNPYKSEEAQVRALSKKYLFEDDWGNQVTHNVIDVRSTFTVGPGIKPIVTKQAKGGGDEPGKAELEFIEEFLAFNGLDQSVPHDWAREAEIEGRLLARLIFKPDKQQIAARQISWEKYGYKATASETDYGDITKITYKVNGKAQDLEPDSFVYRRFGGRVADINKSPPKLAGVLRQVEDLDKALFDWRLINHLFASPTPEIECENEKQAKEIEKRLRAMNWKIGKLLIHTAKFGFKSPTTAGMEMIAREIETHAKMIAGTTGVPVHFLGFVDLMSNRATAENLMEFVIASTSDERQISIGFYTELFQKALTMANEEMGKSFNPKAIAATIPQISSAKMKELVEVWLPLYMQSVVSLQTFLAKIPEVDVRGEQKLLEEDPRHPPRATGSMRPRSKEFGSKQEVPIDRRENSDIMES